MDDPQDYDPQDTYDAEIQDWNAPLNHHHQMTVNAAADTRNDFDALSAEVAVWEPAPCPDRKVFR